MSTPSDSPSGFPSPAALLSGLSGADSLAGPVFDGEQALAIVRLIEAAPAVRRRYQFFVWTQSQMQTLVPHSVLVCGAYQRHRRSVVFDTFHNVVLGPEVLQALSDGASPLAQALSLAWIEGQGRALAVPLGRIVGPARDAAQLIIQALGCDTLLVHGVARPQRPSEIESLFVLASPPPQPALQDGGQLAQRLLCLDLLLPQLHRTWQRVVATEHELLRAPLRAPPPAEARPVAPPGTRTALAITARERQILSWVRNGRSNQQIAEALGISPLTVKNHVQKILRKLGASNRAQAVAQALAQGLIAQGGLGGPGDADGVPP
ncbi:MAG: hypothetical protein KBC73_08420 [Burkholderiaceae bacterium]|nr:hypothetical protein [Burkholderiaceae bacterium]